ncbi:UDP-N-acetylmuramyl-tripeptide synthetase [Rubidibacter lacunae KORDI 51-2]|uniref:UDP-N-acetylmuramoyl-L-alanyl-D-glutamate--2,6-diaminopimelate ligase n=1 Tax=Rubidibacter lacunae KORDI 51-2 TaxID=582515 RepID=U5DJX3_9CHRO|nr:UDP-N-acetylmuramoyl-L-alanyl-D-glutamate--2,6-diaminopimelate ligase [Rubidibacter lacunae]ERN40879.1 UDP-N-acetylmuramyl-tripeptide synthetase [Rubidibacter lacunae KORDI 51-2]
MQLRALLARVPTVRLPDSVDLDREIEGICTNSHACRSGDLFIGMPGTRVDGGNFWSGAIASGASAAMISPAAAAQSPPSPGDCVAVVDDVARACADVATAFYGNPAQHLQLVGVTGTNGKTTTTHLIEFFLARSHRQPALFGTLYARWAGHSETAAFTTPFAADLQRTLAFARDAGCDTAVLEVSSHALDQGRVRGCAFDAAVFTNLTQDHLDYHHDLETYFQAKAQLFNSDYLRGRAIVNADDPYGRRLLADCAQTWSYSSTDATADFHARDLTYRPDGVSGTLVTPLGSAALHSPLVGQFNLANVLAAIAAGAALGLDVEAMAAQLPDFPGVPGRMERVRVSPAQDIGAIVDYAHTPDSLENLLRAARPFVPGRAICVFGCGGDRDRTKRPLMGKIAAELADVVVVTSDNPRTEDPQRILADVLAGVPDGVEPIVEVDRAAAIRRAIAMARSGDSVLIAGKGHEDYQILGTEKVHFDDREQARAALRDRLAHKVE